MPPKRKRASKLFHRTQDPEQIKATRRKASIPVFKGREIMPIARYLMDNEDTGKTWQELYEEFRDDCPHVFDEVANLHRDDRRITIQSCRRCFIMVKGSGKPTDKNRIGSDDEKE